MAKEFIKNASIYLIISFFTKALYFLVWIVLAWWLAPSEIGIYALALFIIELFAIISGFGLNSVIMRFYYHKDRAFILSNVTFIFLLSSLIVIPLFIFTAKWIPILITGLSSFLEENLFLFVAIIFTTSIANMGFMHYMALKKAVLYAKLQSLKILLLGLFSLILVYFGFGVQGLLFGQLFSVLAIAILFIIKERKGVSIQLISPQILKNITNYGFPLMLKTVLGVLVLYFSRILLDKYFNLTTLGVYSFFLMLALQVRGLWTSFNEAWTPQIFSDFLENRKKAIKNVQLMTFLTSFFYLLAMAILVIFGELFLFKLIFKEIYLSNIYIFYILLLMPLFVGIYTVTFPLYYYENRTKRILLISLGLTFIEIVVTFFMVKYTGQTGAAISLFIMSILTTLIYLIAFKKIIQIPSKIINWALILSFLMIINVAITLKTSSSILFLIFAILGAALAYKIGNLGEKKYLLFDFLKEIRAKTNF